MLNMNEVNPDYKTKFVAFRVSPEDYRRLMNAFGTMANVREFLLEVLDSEVERKDENEK